jgi:hypothetical protein
LDWPDNGEVILGSLKDVPVSAVTLLGSEAVVTFRQELKGLKVVFPPLSVRKIPCKWAWTFKITLKA